MSLARQHFLRVSAAARAAETDVGPPSRANAYELQLLALADARRALKQVQSVERKAEVKRRVLPQFAPWVRGVLEADRGGQDLVVMTCMVWLIDIGEFGQALDIADYALRHGLTLPDDYRRDVATLVAEEIAEQALAALPAGRQIAADALLRAEAITAGHDMPDEVRAKLHKAIAQQYLQQACMESDAPDIAAARAALQHFQRAFQLHPRVGVKKDIERLERLLK